MKPKPWTRHLSGRTFRGRLVNAFYVSAILFSTVIFAVVFGILAAYSLVRGILFALGRETRPQPEPQPVLLAPNAHAAAD